MYFKKTIFLFCRISLLVMFLFVTMKSSIFILSSAFSGNDELHRENVVKTAEGKSCNLIDSSCCCGANAHKGNDCCCKSPTLGKGSGELVVGTSESKFFNAIISSINCSNIPDNFQIGSLSDYDPSYLKTFLSLLEETGFQPFIQEDHIVEPHFLLPYKPPKNTHNITIHKLT